MTLKSQIPWEATKAEGPNGRDMLGEVLASNSLIV